MMEFDRRHGANRALDSEEQLRLALDAAQLGLWTWDVATNRLDWTSGVYTMWEVPENVQPTYEGFLNSLHPEDRPFVENQVNEALASGRPFQAEYRIRLSGGRERWIAAFGRAEHDAEGRPVRLRGSVRDISRRKAAEEALRQAESTQRAIVESSTDIIVLLDLEGTVLFANRTVPGITVAEILNTRIHRHLDERHQRIVRDAFDRVIRTGDGVDFPLEYTAPDGERLHFEVRLVPVRTRDRITALSLVARDVTARQAAERAFDEIVRRKSAILEAALDCIITIDHTGTILDWNPAAERTFGYTAAEARGRPMADLIIPPAYRERHHLGMARYLSTGEESILGKRIEVTAQRADGTEFAVELAVNVITADAHPIFTAHVRDITERRQLEAQLLQAQKMEAIGQLAGGVAHDFNNILTVLIAHTDMAGEAGHLPADTVESLREIRAAASRAVDLTRQLLLFSRRQVMQTRSLDLNDIVSGLSRMLRRIIREDVQLQLHLAPAALRFRADPGMIEQVLLNLVVNAKDAMPGGGRLTIETSVEKVDHERARRHVGAEPGDYVAVSVSDTGHGIEADILPRIFEPFFTTKEVGKGTGLGLATVFGVVEQHDGWVEVESEPGRGARFRVIFPADPHGAAAARAEEPRTLARGGTETLLLVEDEAAVRELAARILRRQGYTVHTAESGPDVLAHWSQWRDSVALVVSDLVMPGGLSGQELARVLSADVPHLRVMFLSGYATESAGREFELGNAQVFLQKPFTPTQLLEGVRQALDR